MDNKLEKEQHVTSEIVLSLMKSFQSSLKLNYDLMIDDKLDVCKIFINSGVCFLSYIILKLCDDLNFNDDRREELKNLVLDHITNSLNNHKVKCND